MTDPAADTLELETQLAELVTANHILAREGVVDTFGHISLRHPERPDRFFISRARAPGNVQRLDLLEFNLDGSPAEPPLTQAPYAERIIHGAIFAARPDVHSICHHHAPSVLPFCVAGVPVTPVFHLGATMGREAPFWDSRDAFGDTNMLVATLEQGASLAHALGDNWVVLMRRHGAVVAGRSVRECVFRSVYLQQNAELQWRAIQLGAVQPLTTGEIELAAEANLRPVIIARAWDNWVARAAAGEGRGA